jgi:hypothetical protein
LSPWEWGTPSQLHVAGQVFESQGELYRRGESEAKLVPQQIFLACTTRLVEVNCVHHLLKTPLARAGSTYIEEPHGSDQIGR